MGRGPPPRRSGTALAGNRLSKSLTQGRSTPSGEPTFSSKPRDRLRENPRLHFFVSGQGPLLARVLERAGHGGNLTYAGLLGAREVQAHLTEMDILVNPQKLSHPFARYSFPSKVMRYILLNKPIVSTAFPDISDVPAPGLYFYGNDDPGDLARVLAGLAEREIEVDYRALFDKFSETRTRTGLQGLLLRLAAPRA